MRFGASSASQPNKNSDLISPSNNMIVFISGDISYRVIAAQRSSVFVTDKFTAV